METIGISPRFFTHELNTYSEWEKSFWRELIQNSVDENVSKIEISISQEDGNCRITFKDNGPGMNEETMRNVYFQLGATGKEGADTIGGHGRARILTCFAHESYSIRTQNLLCRGHGGSFQIENHHEHLKGCHVEVIVSASNANTMEHMLRSYLSFCQLNACVTINGEPYNDWLYRRRATRTLSFGTVHTTKHKTYCLVVRVRGVSMFQRHISCEIGAIIEIDPPKSREILTVSRDQMKWEAQSELNNFISEIIIDNKSLGRDCTLNQTEIYGNFKKVGKKGENKPKTSPPKASIAGESSLVWHGAQFAGAAYSFGPTSAQFEPEPIPFPIDFSIHYEDASKSIRASAKRFHQENIGGNRLKLLAAWNETVLFFLEELQELLGTEVAYMPGFAFGKMGGLHREQENGDDKGHILYINPLDSDGKIALSCENIPRLYAIGAHECAHVAESYHNEDYATALTNLTERTVDRTGELKQRIKAAISWISQQPLPAKS